jgi:uncharacterized protein
MRMDGTRAHTGVAVRTLIQNVYLWMAVGLSVTGLVSLSVLSNRSILQAIVGTPGVLMALIIGELVLVGFLSFRIQRMSPQTAFGVFLGYSALNGLTLSPIFLIYTGTSIASTFFITAGMFGAMALYGVTTKRDLQGFGSYFFMGLIGLILASVVNMFLRSDALGWLISFVGVFLFLGLTAYDNQRIASWSSQMSGQEGSADYQRLSVLGALRLYLDFINLFLFLLRFLGRRR